MNKWRNFWERSYDWVIPNVLGPLLVVSILLLAVAVSLVAVIGLVVISLI